MAQKRISLNTSLRDAKIFEEHSDDEKEILTFEKIQEEKAKRIERDLEKPVVVKTEPSEAKEVTFDLSRVKSEIKEEDGLGISDAVAEMQLITPIKNEEGEVKGKVNLKSAKRSLLKQRNSPYTKEPAPAYSTRSAAREEGKEATLYEQLKKTTRNLNGSNSKIETDPEVLKRRQKQIDFGKNTIGYDNYIKQVPRSERKLDDPMTPNKHRVYSRRGFDGLIKQWRLKLHKYDPEDV